MVIHPEMVECSDLPTELLLGLSIYNRYPNGKPQQAAMDIVLESLDKQQQCECRANEDSPSHLKDPQRTLVVVNLVVSSRPQ